MNGGLFQLRRSMSASDFDKDIAARKEEAKDVANVVDFSYRFSKNHTSTPFGRDNKTYSGGLTGAQYVARIDYPDRPARSESLMKLRWREYGSTSIFSYLILERQFKFAPPKLCAVNFVQQLLDQVNDDDGLRQFFHAYKIVRDALTPRGYGRLPKLTMDMHCSIPPQLDAAPLTPTMLTTYSEYISTQSASKRPAA
jgi:hypothetical protein